MLLQLTADRPTVIDRRSESLSHASLLIVVRVFLVVPLRLNFSGSGLFEELRRAGAAGRALRASFLSLLGRAHLRERDGVSLDRIDGAAAVHIRRRAYREPSADMNIIARRHYSGVAVDLPLNESSSIGGVQL